MGAPTLERMNAPPGMHWCAHFKRYLPCSEFAKCAKSTTGYQSYSMPAKRSSRARVSKVRTRSHGLTSLDRAIYVTGATRTCVELKVGFSIDPWQRAAALRATLGHDVKPLDVYRVPGVKSNKDAWRVEGALHRAIVHSGFYRKHGSEVFARSAFEARALRKFIHNYARRNGWQKLNATIA